MSVLYSYPKGQMQHLSARQGELLTLLERSDKHCGWALMCAANGAKGFFPLDYVVKEEDEPESHAAFMQVDRREAERMLLYPGGALGSFLIANTKTRSLGRSQCFSATKRRASGRVRSCTAASTTLPCTGVQHWQTRVHSR